jgi:hypothetical protein
MFKIRSQIAERSCVEDSSRFRRWFTNQRRNMRLMSVRRENDSQEMKEWRARGKNEKMLRNWEYDLWRFGGLGNPRRNLRAHFLKREFNSSGSVKRTVISPNERSQNWEANPGRLDGRWLLLARLAFTTINHKLKIDVLNVIDLLNNDSIYSPILGDFLSDRNLSS